MLHTVDAKNRRKFTEDLQKLAEAPAVARLAGLGQVFAGCGKGHTTRLLHSQEVSDIAGAMAAALGLCEDLARAIGLGHDCGHPPFSHVGERTLQRVVPGFNHAVYGADSTLSALDLSAETLDGVRNHSWSRPSPLTPEGELVRWADRIAYLTRDFSDSMELALTLSDDLPLDISNVLGTSITEQRFALQEAVVSATAMNGAVCMEHTAAEALARYRQFNLTSFYKHPSVEAQATEASRALSMVLLDLAASDSTGEALTLDWNRALDAVSHLDDADVVRLAQTSSLTEKAWRLPSIGKATNRS